MRKRPKNHFIMYALAGQPMKKSLFRVYKLRNTFLDCKFECLNKDGKQTGNFQVRSEDGLALAEYWSCPFTECSAKNAHNVNTVFAEIVREMNYVQNTRARQRQGCCTIA